MLEAQHTVLDASFTLTTQRKRLSQAFTEDAEGDHLVKNAADLVAATHISDGHEVGIDHAGQLDARRRLQIMRKLLSPSSPSAQRRRCPRGLLPWSHVHDDCE